MRVFFLILFFLPTLAHAETFRREQLVFGNVLARIEIKANMTEEEAFVALEQGFTLIRQVEKTFSTYVEDSEIRRLNAVKKPVQDYPISSAMFLVLQQGQELTRLTDHYFDVTFEMDRSGVDLFVLHDGLIDMLQDGLKLNPTGLVKGYTVDQILALFKKNKKIISATVALGGDIGHFTRTRDVLPVQIYDPVKSGTPAVSKLSVVLANQSISTSGLYERGRHIKNTKSSPEEYLQVTVIADTCVVSDALATAMMFMPLPKVREILKDLPHAQTFIIKKDGELLTIK